VDGNSLVHRSYHSQASTGLHGAGGDPIWAVRGLLTQLVGTICLVLGPFISTPAQVRIVETDDHDIRLKAIDRGDQLREQPPHCPDRVAVRPVQTRAGLGVVAAVDE